MSMEYVKLKSKKDGKISEAIKFDGPLGVQYTRSPRNDAILFTESTILRLFDVLPDDRKVPFSKTEG